MIPQLFQHDQFNPSIIQKIKIEICDTLQKKKS